MLNNYIKIVNSNTFIELSNTFSSFTRFYKNTWCEHTKCI